MVLLAIVLLAIGEKMEDVSSDAISVLGQVSSFDELIEHINEHSWCKAVFNCQGKYQHTRVPLKLYTGVLKCDKRALTFKSSSSHDLSCSIVGIALQVAFISAGLMYCKYQIVHGAGLGLSVVSVK